MTIPDEFKWTDNDEALTPANSDAYLSKNEMNIRRCIGEAVPTEIIRCIAHNISVELENARNVQKKVDEVSDQVADDKVVKKQADQIFNEMNPYVTEKTKISIGIRNYFDFICYIKQIASMFVTIEEVEIVALGFSKKEKTNVAAFLKRNAIGVHISISFIDGHFPDSLDFVIRERFERYKQTEQLSLFD
jgi:DNA (cytosine-5)-methyltransferase 1